MSSHPFDENNRAVGLEPEGEASESRSVAPDDSAYYDEDQRNATTTDNNDDDLDCLDDILRGMIFASLAITDDNEKTLEKVGKINPWQVEALKLITGSEEKAHGKLSDILHEMGDGGLTVDCHIDCQGVTKGGHFLDTQGYIAHNDKYIVLSFRCTTSVFDWLTNLNSTLSAWEPQEDLEIGYSGFCSGLEGLCCTRGGEYRPRVHTGFYNNFLACLPMIQKHIDPLLTASDQQPPRTLFVTGHSLGAGVASLATCYFLLQFDWKTLPNRFVAVTAGCPRACGKSMKKCLDKRRQYLGDSCAVYRIVKGHDVVAKVPPAVLGFAHMVPAVIIDDQGQIILEPSDLVVNGADNDDESCDLKQQVALARAVVQEEEEEVEKDLTKYEKFVAKIPQSLRDHMPDFYLKPLLSAKGIQYGFELDNDDVVSHNNKSVMIVADKDEPPPPAEIKNQTKSGSTTPPKKRGLLRRLFKRNMPEPASQ